MSIEQFEGMLSQALGVLRITTKDQILSLDQFETVLSILKFQIKARRLKNLEGTFEEMEWIDQQIFAQILSDEKNANESKELIHCYFSLKFKHLNYLVTQDDESEMKDYENLLGNLNNSFSFQLIPYLERGGLASDKDIFDLH